MGTIPPSTINSGVVHLLLVRAVRCYFLPTLHSCAVQITIDAEELKPGPRCQRLTHASDTQINMHYLPVFNIQRVRHNGHTPRAVTPIVVLLVFHTLTH